MGLGRDGKIRSSSAPPRRRPAAEEKHEQELHEAKRLHKKLTITEPAPFNFRTAQRGEIYQKAFHEHVQQEWELELQQREHRAKPAPDFSRRATIATNQVSPRATTTEPKPFQLLSEARHSEYQQHEAMRLAVEQAKELELRQKESFHALPLPKTTYEPKLVNVAPAQETPLLPMKVELESEKRAKKRHEFDTQMRAKMASLEKMKLEMKEQKKQEDERLIKELRRKV